MDPNETLRKIRTLAETILTGDYPSGMATAIAVDAADLAEAVESLDAWLTRGGFLPNSWKRA